MQAAIPSRDSTQTQARLSSDKRWQETYSNAESSAVASLPRVSMWPWHQEPSLLQPDSCTPLFEAQPTTGHRSAILTLFRMLLQALRVWLDWPQARSHKPALVFPWSDRAPGPTLLTQLGKCSVGSAPLLGTLSLSGPTTMSCQRGVGCAPVAPPAVVACMHELSSICCQA